MEDQVATDAALAVWMHGIPDDSFGDTDSVGHNILARVNHVIMRNLGEHALADDFQQLFGEDTLEIWVHTYTDGSTSTVFAPEDESVIGRDFETAAAEYYATDGDDGLYLVP